METRIRQNKAAHLLNIDGDICHHVHNTCKKFCEPFQYWVESLFGDLYNDIKWSPDLSERLSEVCEILGISYTNPERFVNHRWLSVYDLSVSTLRIIDVLQIFYFGFIPQGSQQDYRGILVDIYRKYNVSIEGRERIREVIDTVKEKKLTEDGRNRKLRIVDKVMFNEKKTKLILNFYQSALLLLKTYVCLFQSKEPLIHVVHDKLEDLFRNFLACFVKPEKIPKSSVQLKQMNLDDENIYLKTSEVFIGHSAKKIIKAARQDDSTNIFFLRNVMQAYTSSAVYMQKKFPLNNKLLKCVSAIDPSVREHSKTAEALRNLKDMVPLISDDEKEKYDLEVQQLQVDLSLKSATEHARIDTWWTEVAKSKKYPLLCKLVFALLSIFHGPQVESSFNTMGDVIDIRSCQMNIETYSAIQCVKYHLSTRGLSAVEDFKRKDVNHDKVDKNLCTNMRNSAAEYKKELEKKKTSKRVQTK